MEELKDTLRSLDVGEECRTFSSGSDCFFPARRDGFYKKGLKGTNAAKETRDWTAPRLEQQRNIASSSQAEEGRSVTPHFRLESQNKSQSLVDFGSTNIRHI